ncbi:Uncharacterized protein TCM_025069 [Theobroma cacao]|uniref:Uncharacterized protein n=1 Tax=Theobroma cacao TaxID=3641 RepID=A0A061EY37_THECC|nr:Uncharacterized protein TCM_025069 [Theobroma cacao]
MRHLQSSNRTPSERRKLLNVLDFLKKPNAKEIVSGTRDIINLYEKFKNAIEASFAGTVDALTQKAENYNSFYFILSVVVNGLSMLNSL